MIRRLSRQFAERHAAELLAFSADQPWENWTAENLLRDGPRKWDLSLIALGGERPNGYAVISSPEEGCHHLHRIAVRPELRKTGIGKLLMDAMQNRARADSSALTLRVYTTNSSAIDFYKTLGFETIESSEGQLLMCRR